MKVAFGSLTPGHLLSCIRSRSTLDVSKLHVQSSQKERFMRDPGIEPGSVPWQGTILPLNQPRFRFHGSYGLYWRRELVQYCSAATMSILCVLTCNEKGNQF